MLEKAVYLKWRKYFGFNVDVSFAAILLNPPSRECNILNIGMFDILIKYTFSI